MKQRWRLLRDGPERGFSVGQQAMFMWSLAAVHNFTINHGQTVEEDETFLAELEPEVQAELRLNREPDQVDTGVEGVPLQAAGMVAFRERLATTMWEDYQVQH